MGLGTGERKRRVWVIDERGQGRGLVSGFTLLFGGMAVIMRKIQM